MRQAAVNSGIFTGDMWQFWIDRGGTFTDCLGRDPATGEIAVTKVLSSDRAPLIGIRRILGLAGDDAKQDQTQFKLLVKQMIVELEDLLRVLKSWLSRHLNPEPADCCSAAFQPGCRSRQ